MPRKTTEKEEKDKVKKVTKSASSKKSTKVANKKTTVIKKAKTGKTSKKENENNSQKKPTAKTTKTKKAISIENPTKDAEFLVKLFKIITNSKETTKKTTTRKKTVTEKPTKEKVATKKTSTTKKATEKKTTKKATTKKATTTRKKKKVEDVSVSPILEYYDLPYRYNETVVKLLAQTPNVLFVYWDISDDDLQKYRDNYGEDFFQNTKPVLIVHNHTKGYAFEVEINDFANSWYLQVEDTKCDYQIELGRRPRNAYANIPNNYLYISASNNLESPNDHILFEHLTNHVLFQNVKTGQTQERYMSTYLSPTGKAYTIYEIYRKIYGKELVTFADRIDFSNPSSGNPSSTFR